jgi:hypothetical protein
MTKKTTAKMDPIDDIQRAWRSLYPLFDAPLARARSAAEKLVELDAKIKAATTDREELHYLKARMAQFELLEQEWNSVISAWHATQKFLQVQKLALRGRKFELGRKPGSAGPIRRAIVRALKCDPSLKPRDLWAMLADAPPRGWTFRENRVGKYIEGPKGGQGMSYARFQNVAKEERDKLK